MRRGWCCLRPLRGRDERPLQAEVDEEISIGDYVLSGGELAAAVLVDAVARLQEGALNDAESGRRTVWGEGLLDCPHFYPPGRARAGARPEVLLSGNHAEIARWRRMGRWADLPRAAGPARRGGWPRPTAAPAGGLPAPGAGRRPARRLCH